MEVVEKSGRYDRIQKTDVRSQMTEFQGVAKATILRILNIAGGLYIPLVKKAAGMTALLAIL